MSQRAATRGFFLCILAVLAALPAVAQTNGGTITFPSNVTVAVGTTSDVITALIQLPVGAGTFPGGTETLVFNGGDGIGSGLSTVPSTVTFSTSPGATSATARFRIAAEPFAFPGSTSASASVFAGRVFAFGTLNFVVEPFSVVPGTIAVTAGTTSDFLTATINFEGGLAAKRFPTAPQTLVFTGLPDGAAPNPSPVTYTVPGQLFYDQVPFRIDVDPSTAPGTYDVTVENSPFQVLPAASFVLTVLPGGSITAAVGKPVMDVCPGGAAVSNSVTVTPVGIYTGTPTVTFPGLPAGLVITPLTFDLPALPPAQTASFTVAAQAGAAVGPREVTVRVSDAFGTATSTTFTVNVTLDGFAPSVAPAAVLLNAGGAAATVTASVAPIDCATPPATVTVTPTGLPPGVTASPASAVLSAPTYDPVVFALVADGSAPAAVVSAAFTFTPSTGAPRTAPIGVTVVRTGRIGVTVERASMDVCPGAAGAPNTLTITPLDGYVGAPTVTFPALPAGLTASPASIPVPAMPPAQTVAFTVTAAPGMSPGPLTVTALVSDPRGFGTPVTFVANVLPPAFTPSAAPAAVTLNAGNAATATIAVSLVAGACAPTSNVTVTPSGLPPGVTVAPASAVLAPPAFAPAPFAFTAASSAVPGPSTITFTFVTSVGTSATATAVVNVCGPPAAPVSPVIQPLGNAQGPVTATDFLTLVWGAPASGFAPTRYEWRINGGTPASVAGTTASAPPRGNVEPIQLFVRAFACDPERGPGPESSSPVYSLSAPVANFSVPASVVAGQAATFTDTSSPQATSWLWFPGNGIPATTVQSPTVTFPTAGPTVVVLVATNGSGSSSKTTTVNVLPASSVRTTSLSVRSFDREPDGRLALGQVEVAAGTTLLLRRLEGEGEAVAFLRLLDGAGRVVVERRLVLAAGEEARHDLSAFATGTFRVEVVGSEGLDAAVEQAAIPFGGPEAPVTPRRPGKGAIR